MGLTVENNLAIQLVENRQLFCRGCLFGETSEPQPELVICKADPEPRTKHHRDFCAKGLWLIDGQVMEFKAAFAFIHKEGE